MSGALILTKEMLYAAESSCFWPIALNEMKEDLVEKIFECNDDSEDIEKAFIAYFKGVNLAMKSEDHRIKDKTDDIIEPRDLVCFLYEDFKTYSNEVVKTYPHFARVSQPYELSLKGNESNKLFKRYYTSAHHAIVTEVSEFFSSLRWDARLFVRNEIQDKKDKDRLTNSLKSKLTTYDYAELSNYLYYECLRLVAEYGYPDGYDSNKFMIDFLIDPTLNDPAPSAEINNLQPGAAEIPELYCDAEGPIGPLTGSRTALLYALTGQKRKPDSFEKITTGRKLWVVQLQDRLYDVYFPKNFRGSLKECKKRLEEYEGKQKRP